MAGSLNKVILIGKLDKDPEIKEFSGEKEKASFSVATIESWKDRTTNDRKEKTEWHRVVVLRDNLIPVVKDQLKKGSKVYLEGQLQTRKWSDENGQDKYITEVVLQGFNSALIPLDGKNTDSAYPDNEYINKVMLIGNLGKDPEFRNMSDGKELASFSIATSESWKDKTTNEKKEKTEWHRMAVFVEGLIPVIRGYVKKGSKVYLEGHIQTRKWTDGNGQEKYTTEVVLQGFNSSLLLLDSKGGMSTPSNTTSAHNNHFDNNELDDEIPF